MKQTTFASRGFEVATKRARKRIFREERSSILPWGTLVGIIQGDELLLNSGIPSFPSAKVLHCYLDDAH
jgi:hypothetical protein